MAAQRRVVVVGSGAVGGFVAARLTLAGADCTVVTRGTALAALQAGPLRLLDDGHELSVSLRAVEDARDAGPFEFAVVCVKSFDTEAAARSLAPALSPGAVVLSLQNGVENPTVLAREIPDALVGGVATYVGCERTAPDRVVRRPSRTPSTGELRDRLVGGPPGPVGDFLTALGQACGVPTLLVDRPEVALWTKLVANVSLNTVTALGRARVGRVLADPRAVSLMLALGREVVAVARAQGINVPVDAAEAYIADARRRLPATGGSSTLFDLEAGRRLEREALIGAVVREGARHGVATPTCSACDALLGLLDPGVWRCL